jgi:hypothetical protein
MNSRKKESAAAGLQGHKHLYARPELLTPESHGHLGFRRGERSFEFVRETIAIPVTTVEFSHAQRSFPIVFSDMDNPLPLAVMGLPGGTNLFVEADGSWDRHAYVPGYLRCHPLALAPQRDGRVAVVIDTAAACITDQPEVPFFINDRPSETTEELIGFCGKFDVERGKTEAFSARMKDLELLAVHSVTHKPGSGDETPLAEYVTVDARKLDSLDATLVVDLYRAGYLQLAWLQVNSVDNWRRLVAAEQRRERAG